MAKGDCVCCMREGKEIKGTHEMTIKFGLCEKHSEKDFYLSQLKEIANR